MKQINMKLLGKLMCALKGHRRGKRLVADNPMVTHAETGFTRPLANHWTFRCPRCGATHTRKVKVKA